MTLFTIAKTFCPLSFLPILEKVQGSKVGRSLVSGAFWMILGHGLSRVMVFIAIVCVARILGKSGLGEFSLIRSVTSVCVAFSGFGIGVTTTKYIAELLSTDKIRVGRIVGMSYLFTFVTSLIVALLFYVSAPWICDHAIQRPALLTEMRLGALLLFCVTFMGTQTGVMQGFQDFRGLAVTNILVGCTAIPFYAGGAHYGGVRGALYGLMISILFNIAVNSFFIYRNMRKHEIRYLLCESYKEMPVLWHFSLPTVLCLAVYSSGMALLHMLLARQENGIGELGFFCAAMDVQMIVCYLPTQVRSVVLPSLSELLGRKEYVKYAQTVIVAASILCGATIVFSLPCFFAPHLIMNIYGEGFSNGASALVVLGVGAIFLMIWHSFLQVLISRGKAWSQLTFVAFRTFFMLLLAVCFTYTMPNAFGFALAFTVSHMIGCIPLGMCVFLQLRRCLSNMP